MPSPTSSYIVPTGTLLTFRYNIYHNLYLMQTQAAYDSCDLAQTITLAGSNHSGGEPGQPYNKYEIVMATAGTHYFTCHISGHCAAGQKITVTAVDPPSMPPPSTPPSEGGVDAMGIILPVVVGVAASAIAVLIGKVVVKAVMTARAAKGGADAVKNVKDVTVSNAA